MATTDHTPAAPRDADETRAGKWTFGFRDMIATYEDEVRDGIVYSRMVSSRPRSADDPPFVPLRGRWEQKGNAWIFTPSKPLSVECAGWSDPMTHAADGETRPVFSGRGKIHLTTDPSEKTIVGTLCGVVLGTDTGLNWFVDFGGGPQCCKRCATRRSTT